MFLWDLYSKQGPGNNLSNNDQPNLLLSMDHLQSQMVNAKHLMHFKHEMSLLIDVSFSGDNQVEKLP